MAPGARAGAVVRRALLGLLPLLVLTWLLPTADLGAPVAEAAPVRTGNLWTVTPGVASEIQPAINAARDNGGGRVRLPAALYLLTAKISVPSNVILYGDGMDRTVLRWAPGRDADTMMSNSSSGNGNTNLQVWDLTLDGEGRSGPSGETNCCFGLRLNNVRNSFVVNVATDRHSKDGIYLGYNDGNGAINNRLSGCRANGNGRNGIALIHGDSNVIDHCQVNGNSTRELVAGIDLEPDEGLALTSNKVVSNSVNNNRNNGIQFFVRYNGFATSYHNSACYNTTSGNQTGIDFFRGDQNAFVDNHSSNENPYSLDDSTLIGSQYGGFCGLGTLPPHPATLTDPTPTPSPTPRPSCTPRPSVTITSQRGTAGTLVVTVRVTRSAAAPNNTVSQLQFKLAQNAIVEISGQAHPGGNFTETIPAGAVEMTFTVQRQAVGQATTVPFAVVDDCGAWQTFVGGGPGAF
jgi:parallel beta-helix repeat protein